MVHYFFVLLHGGAGLELTLLEYAYRVLLHLLAFVGIAILVAWGADVVGAVRSTIPHGRE